MKIIVTVKVINTDDKDRERHGQVLGSEFSAVTLGDAESAFRAHLLAAQAVISLADSED